jgi:hypothetical protein
MVPAWCVGHWYRQGNGKAAGRALTIVKICGNLMVAREWPTLASVIERSGILLGRVRRIRICRRLLRALRRHFCRRWLAGNTTRSKQLLLDVILGLAWQSIIKLARFTEYQHLLTPDFLLSPGDFNRR